jgi:hypothetical protein
MHGKPEVDVFIFATKYISISFQLHSLCLREGKEKRIENRPVQNFNLSPPLLTGLFRWKRWIIYCTSCQPSINHLFYASFRINWSSHINWKGLSLWIVRCEKAFSIGNQAYGAVFRCVTDSMTAFISFQNSARPGYLVHFPVGPLIYSLVRKVQGENRTVGWVGRAGVLPGEQWSFPSLHHLPVRGHAHQPPPRSEML